MSLVVVPITLAAANAFVAEHHRHNKPVRGCRFVLAVADEAGIVRGVAVAGRPKSRVLQARGWLELTRVCTDGTLGACSMLYRRAHRVAQLLGHSRLTTYTLPEEGGASLRAAGWHVVDAAAGGGTWDRASRRRTDGHPTQRKVRWAAGEPS